MRSKLIIICLLLAGSSKLLSFQYTSSKDTVDTKPTLTVGTGGIVSYKDQLPFWLTSNNSARFNSASNLGVFTQINLQKQTGPGNQLDYFYGLEGIAFTGQNNELNLVQVYAGVRFRNIELSIGKQEEVFGLNDSTLSMGDLVYTNNAAPLPKVVLKTDGWMKSPVWGDVFSFKAYLAHGWFESDRYQSGAMLHQKSLYVRSQFLNRRFSLIAGLNHNAQWGGRNLSKETVQPTGLMNFARIFLAAAGGADAVRTDQINALGNHLGNYHLSAGYRFRNFTIRNYWQFLWEDSSGLAPFNWRDGLFGFSVALNNTQFPISGFNLEIIHTNDQGAVKNHEGLTFIEPNNYLNNGIYKSGWTYHNIPMGNPVFVLLNPEADGLHRIKNMVNAVNLGISGQVKTISYRINYHYFKNQGTYKERFDPSLTLKAIVTSMSLPAFHGQLDLKASIEWGNYPTNNAGFMITYSRRLTL